MQPWLQRLLTVVVAGGCAVGAALLPSAAPILGALATGLAGWAIRHPADK